MKLIQEIGFSPDKLKAARESTFPEDKATWVAEQVFGWSRSDLWAYENGHVKPPADKLLQMMIVYGVRAKDLVNKDTRYLGKCLEKLSMMT